MGKKAYYVHMKNKYPHADVEMHDDHVLARSSGEVLCAVEKDGLGRWLDGKDSHGARDSFSLEPLPKDCRFMKLYKDGRVGKSEEHDDRKPKAQELASKHGFVPSERELKEMEVKK